ncbi:MAG: hypothetical protein KJ559_03520 [Nanoarchaeota archaeon]|nr:hypothetical protein [Nanoarchaeota archaeon]
MDNPSWNIKLNKDFPLDTHNNFSFTQPMLEKFFLTNKLKIIYKDYINTFCYYNSLQLVSWLIPRIRPELIIVGQKISKNQLSP